MTVIRMQTCIDAADSTFVMLVQCSKQDVSVIYFFPCEGIFAYQGFPGSSGRASVVVNWLKAATVVRYLEITPKQYVGNKCLRVRVLGCSSSE